MSKRSVLLSIVVMACLSVSALGQVDARLFRFPDVSETHICFVYAGDIWVVEKQGGTARRLSSPMGEEQFPRYSSDGSKIAFSANYDGSTDVYVVPSLGGEPVRVTHHPGADRLVDWNPDDASLMFASSRHSGIGRVNQLYRVKPSGGLPESLPLAYGEFGAVSEDGRQLAFITKNRGSRTWKRYRGGLAPDIWLIDLETLRSRNLTESAANDSQPMWYGKTLYFLSDRGPRQRANIWTLDTESDQMQQLTRFSDFDISYPAIGPSDMVFQAGGKLFLLDLGSGAYREVKVDVVTDMTSLRPQNKNVSRLIQSWNISPTGKRALFEARGEIFSVPAEHGPIRKLTHSSGAAERYPAWSPDGRNVAYWSDISGEYELVLRSAHGKGEEQTLTELGPGFRYRLFWSPDSKKIAFIDHAQVIQIHDVDQKELTRVDQGLWRLHPALAGFKVSWSSDSRWLAYSRGLETSNGAVFLYDTSDQALHQVTSGYFSDNSPVFDPDGKYLYYLSNRDLSPVYSDLDATWIYPNTTKIVAVPLRKDVPSPLAPRNDEEPMKEEKEEKEGSDKSEEDAEKPTAEEPEESEESKDKSTEKEGVEIDLDGFESRAVILPPEAGNYASLAAVSGKVVYRRTPRSGAANKNQPIGFYDLKDRKENVILDNANVFEISADGKQVLVRVAQQWGIVKVAPKQKMEKRLRTGDLETVIDPRSEWRQLFTEVWRTYRDYFYDPGMHGLDWTGLREHYGDLLQNAVTRWDVNFVIGELIGEVNASHTYVGGGDAERAPRRGTGLLGIDWELGEGAYRVGRIVRGASWDAETRSPLTEPGVEIEAGEYILAVNGQLIDTDEDPYAAFEGLAGKTVTLSVNAEPSMEGAREVLVKTLSSEQRLRNLEWIEKNRLRVDKATGGDVGYIFVPNTGTFGQTELVRQFKSQMLRKGLIIDERFNGGGQLPDRFIELMNRKLVNRIKFRNGGLLTHPAVTHYGAKVMLINGWAGSGGDAFPYFFKGLNVGPLIGERTWGGLIGPATGHRLIDGGFYTAPPGRIYGPDGRWFAEGHGVDPDIPVVDDPGELARGRDPQLEAAIEEVVRLIRENPAQLPEPPVFEDRTAEPKPRNR